ncbi:MAG: Bug family tripartite tricarboxylate transporter substrate binding protein [Burkholderiales bacterium]
MNRHTATYTICLTLCTSFYAAPVFSQSTWPTRSVRIIVPSTPGGGTDHYARLMSAALSESFKQQFVVDNRPGGNGNIGAEAAARSTPDGHTIMIAASPSLIMNPILYKSMPFNAEKDFAPVAGGVISPLIFVVHPSVPARNVAELVAVGKKSPGKLTYGSAQQTSSTALGVRLLEDASGAQFTNIPYKGLGQAVQNLLSGEISFMYSDVVAILPHLRAGKVIALGASTRISHLPDVPTVADAGYPEAGVHASFMVVAPSGTPQAIIQRLNGEILRVTRTPDIATKLEAMVLIPYFESPAEFGARLIKEREKWAAHIKRLGVKLDE